MLAYWIEEREKIRHKKEAGVKPPWTEDPILRAYRFCNVHREDDRVTRWITKNWRNLHLTDPYLWHAMLVARFINWPDTLTEMGYPEPWNKRRLEASRKLTARQLRGDKVFTGAYIVSTNGVHMNKVTYVLTLFERAWGVGQVPKPKTLEGFYYWLAGIKGIGSFMAAQIIADLKYTPALLYAPDWKDWCAPGPGSQRGLNRVLGLPLVKQWKPDPFIEQLRALRRELTEQYVPQVDLDDLQDLQNCLCEFDKYSRVLHGKGRPRSRYHPTGEAMP